MVKQWQKELIDSANPEKIKILSSFFKTGKGQYGEGDRFIGLTTPDNRAIARCYATLPLSDISTMLQSPIHEFRLSGFLALVEMFKNARKDEKKRAEIVEFYLKNATRANNWDLVDLSAPKILGIYLLKHPDPQLLDTLSYSENLWEQRIAIVCTMALIANHQYDETLRLAERYISHPHELIHKATGWMLREVGKKGGRDSLLSFLDRNAHKMPRTALRYAIEHFDENLRRYYMNKKKQIIKPQ